MIDKKLEMMDNKMDKLSIFARRSDSTRKCKSCF